MKYLQELFNSADMDISQVNDNFGVSCFFLQRRIFLAIKVRIKEYHGAVHFIKSIKAVRNTITATLHWNTFAIRTTKLIIKTLEKRRDYQDYSPNSLH